MFGINYLQTYRRERDIPKILFKHQQWRETIGHWWLKQKTTVGCLGGVF